MSKKKQFPARKPLVPVQVVVPSDTGKVVKLSPAALARVKGCQFAIAQARLEIEALANLTDRIIKEDVGVEIGEGDWNLDTESGEISHA